MSPLFSKPPRDDRWTYTYVGLAGFQAATCALTLVVFAHLQPNVACAITVAVGLIVGIYSLL